MLSVFVSILHLFLKNSFSEDTVRLIIIIIILLQI